jgi:hypothetical protein
MRVLQDAIDETLSQLPQIAVAELVERKLKDQGITLSKRRFQNLVKRLMKDGSAELRDVPKSAEPNLAISDEDVAELERRVKGFLKTYRQLIQNLTEERSASILAVLKKRWPRESRFQRRDKQGFQKRLHQRWGMGLEALKMLVTIARELGDDINRELRQSGKSGEPHRVDVLTRMHARACQIAEEIICLLSNGFADGAMARWRTLYEIVGVCMLINQHGEALAERYVAHGIVESRKAADQYQKFRRRLKQKPFSRDTVQKIKARYDAALAKYGRDFRHPQGWAAHHLNKANPSIADVQEGSGIEHLLPYYRLASHNVHANPKGVFYKLGLLGESDILLAGPSNAGLADPGHNTALSILQVSMALAQLHPTFDHNVAMLIMSTLVDEIGESLLESHQQLARDEEFYAASGKQEPHPVRTRRRR